MLPKKRKFDPSALDINKPDTNQGSVLVSIVQNSLRPPQITAVDYSRSLRSVDDDLKSQNHSAIDLTEWCDHRVLAKQGDWYHPGVIRQAIGSDVSLHVKFIVIYI